MNCEQAVKNKFVGVVKGQGILHTQYTRQKVLVNAIVDGYNTYYLANCVNTKK